MIYFYTLTDSDDPTHNQTTWRHHVLFYMSWVGEGGGLWAWPCGLRTLPVGYFLPSVTTASRSGGVAPCSTCWAEAGKTVCIRAWTTGRLGDWMMVIFLMTYVSQKILIVQKFGVLASLPEAVEAEVKVELNHLFAWREKHSVSHFSEENQPETLETLCKNSGTNPNLSVALITGDGNSSTWKILALSFSAFFRLITLQINALKS